MVDVEFVLMLFFLASAGLKIREREFPTRLPGRGDLSPNPAIVVGINDAGEVSINDRVYGATTDKTLPALRAWLRGVVSQFGIEEPLLIRPAPSVPHERLIDVLDAAAAGGMLKVTFS
jgi:biopolymer transport protein ExbD